MSLLRRVFPAPQRRDASLAATLAALRGAETWAGMPVDHRNALANDTVWACVTLLADVISTLPLDGIRSQGAIRKTLEPAPAVLDRPSSWLTRPEWLHQVVWSMAVRGNAIGIITARDAQLRPTQVELLDPSEVEIRRLGRTGPPTYRLRGVGPLDVDDVLHIPAPAPPGGIAGVSYVDQAAQTIGFALAAERYGAQWFGDGTHPSAILSTEQRVDEAQARTMKERFRAAVQGREIAVLGQGVKYEPIQGDPERSQLAETSRLLVERICRFWRIWPEMIGAATTGGSVTYANREQRAIDIVTFTFAPWLTRIEARLSNLLVRGTSAKFNIGALLRADTKARFEVHDIAIRSGMASRDERRALEDQEPIADGTGDEYLWPPYATNLNAVAPAGGNA